MAWCPKCSYEYRDEIIVCADCGCELTDIAPAKASTNEPSLLAVLEIAFIYLIAPWLFYLEILMMASSNFPHWIIIFLLPFIVAAMLYGRYRRIEIGVSALVEGWIGGIILQFLLSLLVMYAHVITRSYRIIVFFVFAAVFSLFIAIWIWVGSRLRPSNRRRRPPRTMQD
jgi:hypothetical protein